MRAPDDWGHHRAQDRLDIARRIALGRLAHQHADYSKDAIRCPVFAMSDAMGNLALDWRRVVNLTKAS